jgi:ribonucleoside-diphosphate reductase alpha chain
VNLAREKGAFPKFDAHSYLKSPGIAALPSPIRHGIAENGIRNSHLTAIAPAGSISLLAGNVSSGIEPIFQLRARRRLRDRDGAVLDYEVVDHAYGKWRQSGGRVDPPEAFVIATDVGPEQHLLLQAAVQPFVDGAISKTVNLQEAMSYEAFEGIYQRAYELGLSGCAVFRPNPVTGSILREAPCNSPC